MNASTIWEAVRGMSVPEAVQALLNVAANMALNNLHPKRGLNKRIFLSMVETAVVTAEERAEMQRQEQAKAVAP